MGTKNRPGRLLNINLSIGKITHEDIPEHDMNNFLGGFGLNNKLAFDHIPAGVDPLSPENRIIIGAGALAGTSAPASPKVFATTKLPINTIGSCSGGGGFSDMLKFAGYDNIMISGKSEHPVYIEIDNDRIGIRDASRLWGKDTFETTDTLKKICGNNAAVICIGQAGENLISYALTLVNKYGTLGRGGLGAVFGSKKLKAIVVKGSKGVHIHNRDEFQKYSSIVLEKMKDLPFRPQWTKYGVYIGWPSWSKVGFVADNWTKLMPEEEALKRFGPKEYTKCFNKSIACPSCPLADKANLHIPVEGDKYINAPVSYGMGAILSWGSRGNVEGYREAAILRNMSNKYGIDDFTASAIIDFIRDIYNRGLISKQDLDNMEPRSDFSSCCDFLEKIIKREGIGDLLADGFPALIDKFGKETGEFACTIKGLDAFGDPRGQLDGMLGLSQFVNPRGPYGIAGNSPAFIAGKTSKDIRKFLERMGLDKQNVNRVCSETGFSLPRLIPYCENQYSLFSSLGICVRMPVVNSYSMENIGKLYAAFSGINLSASELMLSGERAWNIIKMANVREGFTRKDDSIPPVLLRPLESDEGEIRLRNYERTAVIDEAGFEKMLDEYYDERGWDKEEGIPTQEKLKELGLGSN